MKKIIECFPYNGEEDTVRLKMKVNSCIVDYYVITEGALDHHGREKPLRFDIKKFAGYEDKIIYKVLDDMPYPYEIGNGSREFWENEKHMRNKAYDIISGFAGTDDLIIMSDADEIVTPLSINEYNGSKYQYAATEMFLYYFYYNQLSVLQDSYGRITPNYWYKGAKIIKFGYLAMNFQGDLTHLRNGVGCNTDISSRRIDSGEYITVECSEQLIRKAGWHFTYILDDKKLLKKINAVADNPGINYKIKDFNIYRHTTIAPNSFWKHIDIESEVYLPKVMLEEKGLLDDFIQQKENSFLVESDNNDVRSSDCLSVLSSKAFGYNFLMTAVTNANLNQRQVELLDESKIDVWLDCIKWNIQGIELQYQHFEGFIDSETCL